MFSEVDGRPYTNDQKIKLGGNLKANNEVLNMMSLNGVYNSDSDIICKGEKNICKGLPTEGALMALA